MTMVVDITCPECSQTKSVQKEGIGAYRCTNCGTEFSQQDIDPTEDT